MTVLAWGGGGGGGFKCPIALPLATLLTTDSLILCRQYSMKLDNRGCNKYENMCDTPSSALMIILISDFDLQTSQ